VLWVLAVLSTITVIHRIKFTYEDTTLKQRLAAAEKPQFETESAK